MIWLLLFLAAAPQPAPFKDETLAYTINWPSGLGLGESRMRAARAGERWELEFTLEAAIPGLDITSRFRSITGDDFCSLELEKRLQHGKRKANERTAFDPAKGVATRETLGGGGKTEIPAAGCARDALAFLYHLRRELAQGRLPAPQNVFLGAQYRVALQYAGSAPVRVNDVPMEADRLTLAIKGPASEHTAEIFFARDPVRTPLMVRVPFPLGAFSMELVR